MKFAALVAFALVGCGGDLDPPWQLDHDRIIAIRATPAAILSGERAVIDGLTTAPPGVTSERAPNLATVLTPKSLERALAFEAGSWTLTAPDEAALAAARDELALPAGSPVPVQLAVVFGELAGLKSVTIGVTEVNPTMPTVTIDGAPAPAPGTEIVVDSLVDVILEVAAAESDDVNWLTSCGGLRDFDLPMARVRVELEDPTSGELALVLRNEQGGVVWQVWPIRAR